MLTHLVMLLLLVLWLSYTFYWSSGHGDTRRLGEQLRIDGSQPSLPAARNRPGASRYNRDTGAGSGAPPRTYQELLQDHHSHG